MYFRTYYFAALLVLVACSIAKANVQGTTDLSQPWHDAEDIHARHILEQREKQDAGPTFTGESALYLLFAVFTLSSVGTCISGLIVTLQWPNPNACCFRTPHSDIPSNESCGCCALHRLNIGFAVTWLALLVLLVLNFLPFLMAAAGVLSTIHAVLGYRIMRQLKQSHAAGLGMDAGPDELMTELGTNVVAPAVVTGMVVERPLPGVPLPGIPVVSVPLSVALVETQLQTHVNFNEEQAAQRLATVAEENGPSATDGSSPDEPLPSKTLASTAPAAAVAVPPGSLPQLVSPPAEAVASGSGSHTAVTGSASGNQMLAGPRRAGPIAPVVDPRVVGMQLGERQGSAHHTGRQTGQDAWGEVPAWPQPGAAQESAGDEWPPPHGRGR